MQLLSDTPGLESLSYKGISYKLPPHKWVRRGAVSFDLLGPDGAVVGQIDPYERCYETRVIRRKLPLSGTLAWAQIVVLMEAFHPGALGEDIWF